VSMRQSWRLTIGLSHEATLKAGIQPLTHELSMLEVCPVKGKSSISR
jgi:hypothetical protein